jgi:hypothetical protein
MGAMLPTAKMPRDIERHYTRGPKLEDVQEGDIVGRSVSTLLNTRKWDWHISAFFKRTEYLQADAGTVSRHRFVICRWCWCTMLHFDSGCSPAPRFFYVCVCLLIV